MSGLRISQSTSGQCVGKAMPRAAAGFTLVELMIVLVIVAVVVVMAGPGFMEASLNSKLKTSTNALLSSVYSARGEAIKRNVPVRLCASADGSSCATSGDWEQGWVVLDPNDVVIESQQALPPGYKMTSTGGLTLTFQPSGLASTSSTIKVCRSAPEPGRQERLVTVWGTGRPSVTKTTTASCPS
jgi:type IV fimbrial biogenesis protein FimT